MCVLSCLFFLYASSAFNYHYDRSCDRTDFGPANKLNSFKLIGFSVSGPIGALYVTRDRSGPCAVTTARALLIDVLVDM